MAWEIGSIIRRRAQSHAAPIAINITSISGHLFFHALSKPGTNLDNQEWVERKRRTVIRFGRSSFYMGCKLRRQNKSLEQAFFIDEKDYATHGGGFPIRVRGTEGIVAVISVSGLRQDLDHNLIYESLKEFLQNYQRQQQQQQPQPQPQQQQQIPQQQQQQQQPPIQQVSQQIPPPQNKQQISPQQQQQPIHQVQSMPQTSHQGYNHHQIPQ